MFSGACRKNVKGAEWVAHELNVVVFFQEKTASCISERLVGPEIDIKQQQIPVNRISTHINPKKYL